MNNKSTVNIFWCPLFNMSDVDWNMLYYDPENLYDCLRSKKTDSDSKNNFFYCPVFSNFTQNTFFIRNPIHSHFIIQNNDIHYKSTNYIKSSISRPPSVHNHILMEYGLKWLFFAEDEDVELTLTSPYFEAQPHMKYGCIVPGRFNISSWFRPISLEFNLQENISEFKIDKDEALAYIHFNTNKKINLIRFENNFKLESYAKACSTSSRWESWIPLKKRYERFQRSRMKELVLKQIKNNLV